MIELEEKFDGHIILYCKGWYNVKDVDFITGLQRIWAVRCGIGLEDINLSFNEYIANRLYRIFAKTNPNKLPYILEILHKGVCNNWNYKDLNGIERIIMVYIEELMQLQIKSMDTGKTLIKIPKPQKRLFKKIVKGKGTYNDYELVK